MTEYNKGYLVGLIVGMVGSWVGVLFTFLI